MRQRAISLLVPSVLCSFFGCIFMKNSWYGSGMPACDIYIQWTIGKHLHSELTFFIASLFFRSARYTVVLVIENKRSTLTTGILVIIHQSQIYSKINVQLHLFWVGRNLPGPEQKYSSQTLGSELVFFLSDIKDNHAKSNRKMSCFVFCLMCLLFRVYLHFTNTLCFLKETN